MLVSVIIPTRNRATSLQITLNSILRQTSVQNLEVIIVDNGSEDNTAAICANYLAHNLPQFIYLYEPEPGLLSGRHRGAAQAKGEILCFLDDDVELSPNWLNGVKEAFTNPKVCLATGPCLPQFASTPPTWLKYFCQPKGGQAFVCTWLSLQNLGNCQKWVHPNAVWGLNFCIRNATFKSLGGFHPDNIPASLQRFQGDGETGLTYKAAQVGLKAWYHPKIKLQHLVPAERLTSEYFIKRAYYQGVCNSFTALRNTYGLNPIKQPESKAALIKNIFKLVLFNAALIFKPKAVRKLVKALQQQEAIGFAFHQAAFYSDPKVKAWVLKPDYWDYYLPV